MCFGSMLCGFFLFFFAAKLPLDVSRVASPHFVLRLLQYLLEQQSVGTLVKKVLMLISCDMTS